MNELDSLKAIIDSISTIQSSIPVDVVDTLSKSNTGIDFYNLVPLATLILGILTLLAYIIHNVIAVKPLLRIDSSWYFSKNIFYLELSNHGLGPAIIESLDMYWDGKKIKEIPDFEIVDQEWLTDSPISSKSQLIFQKVLSFSKGDPLKQSSEINFLEIYYNSFIIKYMHGSAPTVEISNHILKNLTVTINYKTMYNKKIPTLYFPKKIQ